MLAHDQRCPECGGEPRNVRWYLSVVERWCAFANAYRLNPLEAKLRMVREITRPLMQRCPLCDSEGVSEEGEFCPLCKGAGLIRTCSDREFRNARAKILLFDPEAVSCACLPREAAVGDPLACSWPLCQTGSES